MARIALTIITLLLSIFPLCAQQIDYQNYKILFEDEFNYVTTEELINSKKWQFTPDDSCYGWGDYTDPKTKEKRYGEYYDKKQVKIIQGGILRLSATKLNNPIELTLADDSTKRYPHFASGMIQTPNGYFADSPMWDNNKGFTYGMFEIKCKLPQDNSFPAFWLYQGNTEIDIFESNGGADPNKFSNTIHDNSTKPSKGMSGYFQLNGKYNLINSFHTYTCVWTPNEVSFFLDGSLLRTVKSDEFKTYKANAALIANLGMWPWSADNMHMDIDYIKVYKPVNNDYSLPYIKPNSKHNKKIKLVN